MLPDTTVLNAKAVAEIVKMGYTRIPVYCGGDKNNVTDLLFVKVSSYQPEGNEFRTSLFWILMIISPFEQSVATINIL